MSNFISNFFKMFTKRLLIRSTLLQKILEEVSTKFWENQFQELKTSVQHITSQQDPAGGIWLFFGRLNLEVALRNM